MASPPTPSSQMSRNSDFSYFSAVAPLTTSASSSSPAAPSQTQSLEITQPIITSSVLSSSRMSAFCYNQHVQNLHQLQHQHQLQQQRIVYTPHSSEELRQFALHIPAPPQLTMPAKMLAKQTSSLAPYGASDSYQGPDMVCTTDMNSYLLSVTGLPTSITSDMVTISANKGDRLHVNAQAWGSENAGKLVLSLLSLKSLTFVNFSPASPIPRHLLPFLTLLILLHSHNQPTAPSSQL